MDENLTETRLIESLDTQDDRETEEEHSESPGYNPGYDWRFAFAGSVNQLLSSSFNLVLTTLVLSTGLFFSVIVITLWENCPTIIWGAFLGFSLLAPLALVVISVLLLSRYGMSSRYSLREH